MVSIFEHNGKTILVVDYSHAKGDQLIDVFENARKLVLEKDLYVYVINIWDERSYISPAFLSHISAELPLVDYRIKKQSIIGLSAVQKWIVKAVNLWYNEKIKMVNTQEEALLYFDENE
jgi:hypothetical protein